MGCYGRIALFGRHILFKFSPLAFFEIVFKFAKNQLSLFDHIHFCTGCSFMLTGKQYCFSMFSLSDVSLLCMRIFAPTHATHGGR